MPEETDEVIYTRKGVVSQALLNRYVNAPLGPTLLPTLTARGTYCVCVRGWGWGVHRCIYIHIYIYVCLCTRTHIYIYVFVCVYICIIIDKKVEMGKGQKNTKMRGKAERRGGDEDTTSCSVLQCVAVRCSALQRVAARCSVLQCVAARCSALQCVAVCCSVVRWAKDQRSQR